jgi:hypothetical protein
VVALGACAAVAAQAAPSLLPPSEERFPGQVRRIAAGTGAAARTDRELVASGQRLCAELDAGATAASFAADAKAYDVDPVVFDRLLETSVATFCPEHAAF